MIAGAPTTYGHIVLDEKGVAWIVIIEARRRQREGVPFAGVVFAAQKRVAIGQ